MTNTRLAAVGYVVLALAAGLWLEHVLLAAFGYFGPTQPLTRPLAQTRLALITTAAPYQPGVGDQGPGARYNAAAKFYQVYSDSTETVADVRISHVGYDRVHTSAEDPRTWFPLEALRAAVKRGQLGALTPRFHGAPTNRSQRVTMETDAPELLRRCREDGAEAALLVPS